MKHLNLFCGCLATQSCQTLCSPRDCSTPGFLVRHQLPQLAQTHVRGVSDAIEPSHPRCPLLLPPSIFPSIRVFSNEPFLHVRWPKSWSFSISPSNGCSGLISFRIDRVGFPSNHIRSGFAKEQDPRSQNPSPFRICRLSFTDDDPIHHRVCRQEALGVSAGN